jgi:hypothetical protein
LAIDEPAGAIENKYFRVVVDAAVGGIKSWTIKKTKRELIAQNDEAGCRNYLYERFGQADFDRYMSAYCRQKAEWVVGDFGKPGIPPDAPHEEFSIKNARVRFDRSANAVKAVLEGECGPDTPHHVKLTVTLEGGSPFVDVRCSCDAKPDPWPVAGWMSFSFLLEQPQFLLGRLGGIVDPAKDVIRGANHDVYCLNTGKAVVGIDGTAIGMCPLDAPLVSLERPGLTRYTPDFQPTRAKVFMNLFNNVWSTNFAQWCDPLPPEWRVRLWVGDSKSVRQDLIKNSWEARMPLIMADSGTPGQMNERTGGIGVSKPGVLVTALGWNLDGQGIVLRLWEQAGEGGDCTVTLPTMVNSVQPCDLRGRPVGAPIPVNKKTFTVNLRANAPASFLLQEL